MRVGKRQSRKSENAPVTASTAKIPYIQRVTTPDGKTRLYFRKGDYREGPLVSADGSPELRAEVNAILQALSRRLKSPTLVQGSVGGMILAYAGDGKKAKPSAAFRGLAASTQAEYLRMATEIREDCGDVLLTDVSVPWLRDLIDAWAELGYKAANDRRQVLKNALKPALQDARISGDPFATIGKVARPHSAGEAHPAWEDFEVQAAITEALQRKAPGLARAIALGRWGGFRRGTICRLPISARVQALDENGEPYQRLLWITEKRKVLCDKPEDVNLTELLESTPDRTATVAYNEDGKAWTERALSRAIERLNIRLAAKGKMRLGLSLHGLRHARGVELAEAGAGDAQIMAQLEHATDHTARIYRRQAQRRKLARSAQELVDEKRKRNSPKKAALDSSSAIVKSTVKKL